MVQKFEKVYQLPDFLAYQLPCFGAKFRPFCLAIKEIEHRYKARYTVVVRQLSTTVELFSKTNDQNHLLADNYRVIAVPGLNTVVFQEDY